MPRKPPDPAIVELALDLVRTGASFADAGEAFGVSEGAVRVWAKKAGVSSVAATGASVGELPTHMRPPPAAPPGPPIDTSDLHKLVQSMIAEQHAVLTEARGVSNSRAAGQAAATLAKLATLMKQVEAARADNADTLHFTRADIARARETCRTRAEAVTNRPQLCAECSRRLSVKWGTGSGAGDPGK